MVAERIPAGTEFFSAHIEGLREAMATLDVNDEQAKVEAEIEASKVHWSELTNAYFTAVNDEQAKVEAEIEASKVHWSELTNAYFTAVEGTAMDSSSSSQSERTSEVEGTSESSLKVAEEDLELFRSLQEQYPGFFLDEDDVENDRIHKLPSYMNDIHGHPSWVKVELSSEKPFAVGAQAELFHAHGICEDGSKVLQKWLVMKVFKKGTSLKDLLRLVPPTFRMDDGQCTNGYFAFRTNGSPVLGARWLKSKGRIALLMVRAWGDLRKLIDVRMIHFNNKGLPFQKNVVTYIMYRIAQGMQALHKRDIIHRDLKAANVLIFPLNVNVPYDLDPTSLEPTMFWPMIVDFECSVGVIGTRFWRAPEILLGLKNRNLHQNPKVFSKQSDIYSFGMTCYEILSGGIPFEEMQANNYDGVIGGNRPTLPNQTTPWMMDLVNRCWHQDPLMRPSFKEIVEILRPYVKDVKDEIDVEKNL